MDEAYFECPKCKSRKGCCETNSGTFTPLCVECKVTVVSVKLVQQTLGLELNEENKRAPGSDERYGLRVIRGGSLSNDNRSGVVIPLILKYSRQTGSEKNMKLDWKACLN